MAPRVTLVIRDCQNLSSSSHSYYKNYEVTLSDVTTERHNSWVAGKIRIFRLNKRKCHKLF